MSEQWYAWEHAKGTKQRKRYPGIIYVNPELGDEQYDKTWEVYPVIIRPIHEEPCPWELSQFGDSQPYKNEKDWISFISQYGWRWCPMCGRNLKEE